MVGWHHWFDGHEFEQTLGVGDGQGGLTCCIPWGHKVSDTTEQLNWPESGREERGTGGGFEERRKKKLVCLQNLHPPWAIQETAEPGMLLVVWHHKSFPGQASIIKWLVSLGKKNKERPKWERLEDDIFFYFKLVQELLEREGVQLEKMEVMAGTGSKKRWRGWDQGSTQGTGPGPTEKICETCRQTKEVRVGTTADGFVGGGGWMDWECPF